MKRIRCSAVLTLGPMVTAMAFAKGNAASGRAGGAGSRAQLGNPAASAASPGARAQRGPGARWGSDYTPGWSLMTEQERIEHQQRVRSMTGYGNCKAYMEQHHQQMAGRAKESGAQMPAQPRNDPCTGLKP